MNYHDSTDDLAYQMPLPSNQLRPYEHSSARAKANATNTAAYHSADDLAAAQASAPRNTRGRSESDGFRTMSARSSDDRAPLTTFFGAQAWQRLSTALPQGVRDPLNIDELEREERLMPYTEVSVGAIMGGAAGSAGASLALSHAHASANEQGSSRHLSHLSNAFGGVAAVLSEKGSAAPSPIDWAYMQDHNLRTGGLPSLDQVLTRRTRAPLALRDFAVHCSVRQPQARRWLEFYMAARTHEKMCLAYESDLRHAKARSHYASLDAYSGANARASVADPLAAAADQQQQAGATADPERKAAAHTAAIESLSRGGRRSADADDRVLYPEDDAIREASGSLGAGSKGAFRRSHRQSSRMALQIQSSAETIFLRYFRAALDPNLMQGTGSFWQTQSSTATTSSSAAAAAAAAATARARGTTGRMGSLKRMLTQKTGGYGSRAINGLRPTLDDPYHQGYGVAATDSIYVGAAATAGSARDRSHSGAASMYDNNHGRLGSTPSLTMSRDHLHTPITGDSDGVAMMPQYMNGASSGRPGLGGPFSSSRQHLYYHMPWPPEILTEIEQRLLHDGAALDAALFSEALLYAYDVLDTYYFPIFIADAVSRNVTRDHCILRVLFAFFFLWFGFALPLALILLDHQPKAQRVWTILPQFIGWWNMAVGFGGCDLLLAVMRKYQSPTMREPVAANAKRGSEVVVTEKQQQQHQQSWGTLGSWRRAWFSTRISVDMTATRMVRARSIRWFIGALVMTAVSSAILCAVPGTTIFTD
ncbi:hypothetical protein LPJ53_004860 [Coemansia erecta]|uniref:RGS domain-containing protein n=1 Tax=Coemansia erecta TaxID=147472 RepID=A0A9W8CQW2_9FUNG|nr:hypothetical protein LPJ53_004860 [Coemansia erecta]